MKCFMEHLISVAGPRGAGKEATIAHLVSVFPHIPRLVPFTTREPREGELHGREYYFITKEHYSSLNPSDVLYKVQIGLDDDPGHYFSGTLKEEFDKNKIGIIDITVEGARILQRHAQNSLKLFIFAYEDERLRRVMKRQQIDVMKAKELLKSEPSPATAQTVHNLYNDFAIVHNHDGRQQIAFSYAQSLVKKFTEKVCYL